ncbi:MAG: HAD-IC family P-type ATPase [Burkholderiales bacterium]|nr:HAD-IC family P-type ATPase [Anaerolineae bacterium]
MASYAGLNSADPLSGLSENEAAARRARGEGNNVKFETSRSYKQIIQQNVFTFLNNVLFAIGLVLVALGLYGDALLSVGIVLLNVVVGVIQEARAKRKLDQIALLTRPRAAAIRDGAEKIIDPSEIVMGDILVVRAGDQIVVDGKVVGDGRMDVDESLLTGESDLITKRAGDEVFSGSYCVNGSAMYEAQKVGAESFANQLTVSARAFRQVKTPLQTDIDFVIRVLILLVAQMGILLIVSTLVDQIPISESARAAAVIAGLVPNGLFFMIAVAYAMGALRMAGQGALIQQSNAVESMSNVNVLCLDKTGTLTANRINLFELFPIDVTEQVFRRLIGDFAASIRTSNRTNDAISEATKGKKREIVEEVSFSSARKWSAIAFNEEDMRGVYVLGAPEMLQSQLQADVDLGVRGDEWTGNGYRVLLFAYRPEVTPLYDASEQPQLPENLIPLGLISFSDELRPEAEKTLKAFSDAGIRLKIISGDNPHTVAALAKQAGLANEIKAISGPELAEMSEAEFEQAAEDATIFGRITPQQKEQLVRSLRKRGAYVAMIGDGVNDVLSLKQAHIGIAMQSGSQATRGVADIVLMNDSFAALPPAFLEGQRILNGMQDIMRLFLTRVASMALLIVSVSVIGLGIPFTPRHVSLISLFTVGIPTFALAAWSRPGMVNRGLVRSVIHFVLPAAVTLALVALGVYVVYFLVTLRGIIPGPINTVQDAIDLEALMGMPVSEAVLAAQSYATDIAQTVVTILVTLCGLLLIPFVEPPTPAWAGGDVFSGDWRPTIMMLVLSAGLVAILIVPDLRSLFELSPLRLLDYVIIVLVAGVWAISLRYIWRARLFDRFLNLDKLGIS